MKNLDQLKQDKQARAQKQLHDEAIASQEELKAEIQRLNETINEQEPFDARKFHQQLKELTDLLNLQPLFKSLEESVADIVTSHNLTNKTNTKDFSKLIQVLEKNKPVINVKETVVDLREVSAILKQINGAVSKETKAVSQLPEDYLPYRRVVKVGNRLLFDDQPTSAGRGGGGGIGVELTRNSNTAIAVVNPDGSNISAGGGGGAGDASAANQTNGNQKTQIVDSGGEAATVTDGKLDVNAVVELDSTGLATELKQDDQIDLLTDIETDLSDISTETTLATRLSESDFDTKVGSLTETAPTTDTASSGLNGRLQRLSQRLTSIIALLPGSLGQKARTASLAVTLSSEDVTALTPPSAITGFATSAKQDTIIGHLDGVETLLTDIEADTDTLAVVGSGTEATAQRVTIATDSTGVLSVDDNGSSLTVDNAGLTELAATINGSSQMDVNIAASGATVPVSNGGLTELAAAINSSKVDVNIVSSDVASGGTSTADDADFTAGTTAGTIAQGVYESTPSSVTDGDVGAVGITQGRRLKTSTTVDAALPAGTNNIGDVDIASIAAGDNNIGNVDIVTLPGDVEADIDQIRDQIDLITPDIEEIRVDADAIRVAVETIDNAISGSEMQVDVVTMPTTTVQATNLDIRDLTNTDVVTAELSATDNAVLDSIDSAVNSKKITGIGHGVTTVTTAGTDVALAGSTACKKITIQAQTDNTNAIAVGATGVDATVATGNGVLLFPGDSFELEIDNLADVFIDSLVNGEGVRYVYFT